MKKEDNHLRRKKDFEITFADGYMVSGNLLMLKHCPIDPLRHPKRGLSKGDLKIAFAVSVKISKSAVVRNRTRRIIREALRLAMQEKEIKTGHYLVFIAKNGAEKCKMVEIKTEVEMLLKKARLV
jgi:ribonuclease P protein component